jgi:hypothetical protein
MSRDGDKRGISRVELLDDILVPPHAEIIARASLSTHMTPDLCMRVAHRKVGPEREISRRNLSHRKITVRPNSVGRSTHRS